MKTTATERVPVRAFLSSFLAFRFRIAGPSYVERFVNPWLVWEPGAWRVANKATDRTLSASSAREPIDGDALCFELNFPVGALVPAGRSTECGIVINDATFSRTQLVFGRPSEERYTVARAQFAAQATIDGGPLGEMPRALRRESTITAGDVVLHFVDDAGMRHRLERGFGRGALSRR